MYETNHTMQNESEIQLSDKLKPTDVWKEFNCPKYVARICPKTDKLPKEIFETSERLKVDINYTIKKLDELISDPVTSNSVPRICRILHEYLHEVGDNGYKVKHLPTVMKVLEFLALNVKSIKEYELHLSRMLELCNLPPLLEKSSEIIINSDIMEQYFTLLGHLLIILPTKEQIMKIHEALHSLLLKKSRNPAAVKLAYCRKIMEKSKLPISVTMILESSFPEMYPNILELVFLLSCISSACSHRMLEAGVLNTVLIRMDLPYATELRCMRPPDRLLTGNEYSDDTMLLITNTLWSLMRSILSPKNSVLDKKKNLKCVRCALWGLCYTFKKQVCYSQSRSINTQIRNEIAVIILAMLVSFPCSDFVSSGIADDVIDYLVGAEAGTLRVFSETVNFGKTNDNLFFQKVLLLISTHLAQLDVCIFLMVKKKLMNTVLQLVNPNIEDSNISWSPSQFWNLWTYAINALSVLIPKMPKEFLKYDGTIRLSMILEWILTSKFNIDILMNCIKTLSTVILNDNILLLNNFREHGITLLLIKILNHILDFEKITMMEQRILTLVLISIERLMRRQVSYKEMYADQSIRFIMELLFRCLYQQHNEVQIDQRLLLAIGSYIWECIVGCPMILKKFIEYGAVHIILDIIEIAPYPSRCLFLAVFTDMCDKFFCGPYLCTWRGIDKKTGLISLLATIWREEEIRIKVKKKADGSLTDGELSQMSNKQWLDTYHTKLVGNISPAIVDMIGSVRSKIYSIRKIIERDGERYEMAKERYKILYADLPIEDRITVSSIDIYFQLKLGQIWVEIEKYFEQVGITPLGMDGQAIFLLTQRYNLWGGLLKKRQERLLLSAKKVEEVEEKDEYARIRDSKLILALDAFDELDYICRTTDRAYMIKKKNEQRQQVNIALWFPPDTDDAHCHRTFQDQTESTAVFDQHILIPSSVPLESNVNQMKILPVSPCESNISDTMHSSEFSCPCLSSDRYKEFVEKA